MPRMEYMFFEARFNKVLCGDSWIKIKSESLEYGYPLLIFEGSSGTIGNEICVCNTPGENLADGACLAPPPSKSPMKSPSSSVSPSSPSSDNSSGLSGDIVVLAGSLGIAVLAGTFVIVMHRRRNVHGTAHTDPAHTDPV